MESGNGARSNPWDWAMPPSASRIRGRTVRAGSGARSGREVAYDHLAARFAQCFAASKDRGADGIWPALERAGAELVAGGALTADQAATLSQWLLADLAYLASQRLAGLRPEAPMAADGAAHSLDGIIALSQPWLHRLGALSNARGRRELGEVTCVGSLACRGCGRIQRLQRSTSLAACGACGGEVFMRTAV